MRKSLAKTWFVIKTSTALLLRETILCLVIALGCGSGAFAESDVASNASPAQLPRYTLQQCIDHALEANTDVLTARKHLEQASGAIVEARAGFLPSLTSYANYEWLQADYSSLGGVVNNRPYIWNVNIRLTEIIFAGGAVHAGMAIARLQKQSRTLDY